MNGVSHLSPSAMLPMLVCLTGLVIRRVALLVDLRSTDRPTVLAQAADDEHTTIGERSRSVKPTDLSHCGAVAARAVEGDSFGGVRNAVAWLARVAANHEQASVGEAVGRNASSLRYRPQPNRNGAL
jgi:hypothetical protein